jgi:hypothetical protein
MLNITCYKGMAKKQSKDANAKETAQAIASGSSWPKVRGVKGRSTQNNKIAQILMHLI